MQYKVVVIGGGPGGYVAAIRAAQWGASVALVEKESVGGTCLHRGCIPTKSLATGAEMVHSLRRAGDFGITTGEIKIDLRHMVRRKNDLVGKMAQGIEFLLKKNGVDLFKGTACLAGKGKILVHVSEGTKELSAENIILATGTKADHNKELGYDGKRVITAEEALNLEEVPRRLLILGAGAVGCEFASIFSAFGSKVTLVEAMPSILPFMDKDIIKQMNISFKKHGIKIKAGVKIKALKKRSFGLTTTLENGEEIEVDQVLLATGQVLNLEGLGLEDLGVKLGDNGEVLVDDGMQTSVPGIYAVGDITGKNKLAHVASAQGLVAADNILGQRRQMDYHAVPVCIFTYPEIGSVGMTSQEAEKNGVRVKTGTFPFAANGKSRTMGETAGFVKVLAHPDSDCILGVHVVGPRATELISSAILAVQYRMSARQLERALFAHPTLAEVLMEAAGAVNRSSVHL